MDDLATHAFELVNRELASTLDAARSQLEDYVDGRAGPDALLATAEHLHAARGALKIVEIHGAALLAGDQALRRTGIEHCVRAKLRLVDGDVEDRRGLRALLNLGHSFAHAIETASGLGTVLHGEAVAVGLCLAFGFSVELSLCPSEDEARVSSHIASVGLPTRLNDVDLAGASPALLEAIMSDKKAGAEGISLILASGIGHAEVARGVDSQRLAEFLAKTA